MGTLYIESENPENGYCESFTGKLRDESLNVHIEPGKPVQNPHVESFHGRLRDECLNASWFGNLFEARAKIGAWREEYNEERPHSSLGYLAPREFARQVAAKVMNSESFGVV